MRKQVKKPQPAVAARDAGGRASRRDAAWPAGVLDALPFMVFLIDGDLHVRQRNAAADAVFGTAPAGVYKRRCGEVFHCLHAHDVPAGCGRSQACRGCEVRAAVQSVARGQCVARRFAQVEWRLGAKTQALELVITASPLAAGKERLVLVVLQAIQELAPAPRARPALGCSRRYIPPGRRAAAGRK